MHLSINKDDAPDAGIDKCLKATMIPLSISDMRTDERIGVIYIHHRSVLKYHLWNTNMTTVLKCVGFMLSRCGNPLINCQLGRTRKIVPGRDEYFVWQFIIKGSKSLTMAASRSSCDPNNMCIYIYVYTYIYTLITTYNMLHCFMMQP